MDWSKIKAQKKPWQKILPQLEECPEGYVRRGGRGGGRCIPKETKRGGFLSQVTQMVKPPKEEKEKRIEKIPVNKRIKPVASETDMAVVYQEEKDFLNKLKNQVESQRNSIESKVNLIKGIMEFSGDVGSPWWKKARRKPKMTKILPATSMKPSQRPLRSKGPESLRRGRRSKLKPDNTKQYFRGQQKFLSKLTSHIERRMGVIDRFSSNVSGCPTCSVGGLSVIQTWLNTLPKANWTQKFGSIPTTPGYPESPTTCPLSIQTNLKRIFFSGVNVLTKLNSMLQRGQTQQALQYLNSLKPMWLKWIAEVDRLHGSKSPQHKSILKFYRGLFEYLFNYSVPREFAEDFGKVAMFAYDTYSK